MKHACNGCQACYDNAHLERAAELRAVGAPWYVRAWHWLVSRFTSPAWEYWP